MTLSSTQIAAQLYTVRDLCQTPLQTAQTLQKLKAIGYAGVEIAGICDIDTDELRRMATGEGLAVCAVHGEPNALLNHPGQIAARAVALDCELVVYSYPLGFNLSRSEDLDRLVMQLTSAGAALKSEGRRLCYHHHSLEFERKGAATILDDLLQRVDPSLLSVELDTFWIQHGGGNPEEWCSKMSGRLPILHLKDYGCDGGNPVMKELGNGNLDWPGILSAAAKSGCQWYAVEQDTCPGDPIESLRISYQYLKDHFLK